MLHPATRPAPGRLLRGHGLGYFLHRWNELWATGLAWPLLGAENSAPRTPFQPPTIPRTRQ